MLDTMINMEALNNARYIRVDSEKELVFVWSGSHRVHVYNTALEEINTFYICGFENRDKEFFYTKQCLDVVIDRIYSY